MREPAGLLVKKRQYRAFVTARIVLVGLFIALWQLFFVFGYPMPYGFLVVLTVEMAVLIGFLVLVKWLNHDDSLDRFHILLLACEIVLHSAIFYFLGGVSWLGAIAYLFALMYAAVFLSYSQAVIFATLVSLSFIGVVVLDGTETLPHQWYLPQGPLRYQDADFVVPTTVGFVGVAFAVTIWMVFIGSEMRRERDIAVEAYKQLMATQRQLENLNEELEMKVAERTRTLVFRAEHDNLTGLYNRGSITRRCQEAIALARRSGHHVAVIVADGDRFKRCNDSGGHGYGDHVLRVVADTIRDTSRESDFVGRLGGDEFLIVLPDTGAVGAARYCRRILRALAEAGPASGNASLHFPGLSLGIAIFPDHGPAADLLIRAADAAMYSAKNRGGNSYCLAGPIATATGFPGGAPANSETAEAHTA
jgi:diguanylate cyclase (GGDEF)-like protein